MVFFNPWEGLEQKRGALKKFEILGGGALKILRFFTFFYIFLHFSYENFRNLTRLRIFFYFLGVYENIWNFKGGYKIFLIFRGVYENIWNFKGGYENFLNFWVGCEKKLEFRKLAPLSP